MVFRFADVPVKLGDDGKTMLASKPVFKWVYIKQLISFMIYSCDLFYTSECREKVSEILREQSGFY